MTGTRCSDKQRARTSAETDCVADNTVGANRSGAGGANFPMHKNPHFLGLVCRGNPGWEAKVIF